MEVASGNFKRKSIIEWCQLRISTSLDRSQIVVDF